LLDYWTETLQDDAYLVSDLGWLEAAKPHPIVVTNGQKSKVEPDFVVGKNKFHSDLLPASVLIASYFAESWAVIEKIEPEVATLESQIMQIAEEHGADGGLLEDLYEEDGKPIKDQKKVLKTRLAETINDEDSMDEHAVLEQLSSLLSDLTDAKGRVKTGKALLDAAVAVRYGELTEAEARLIVVRSKWLAKIEGSTRDEINAVVRRLAQRVGALGDRYARPMPQTVESVAALQAKVNGHLRGMGFSWE
jgi:type I restriction enzyme M protein